MTSDKFSWYAQQSRIKLLILGFFVTIFAFSLLPTIWTSKSELVYLKGTLQSANTYISTVTNTDKYGINHNSQKAELIFYLNEFKQKYYLSENIENDYQGEENNNILKGLKHADSISVWIRKKELNEWQPEIFEIDNDNSALLDFDKVKTKDRPLFLCLSILGIGCITFYFWSDSPTKIRRAFGIKDE